MWELVLYPSMDGMSRGEGPTHLAASVDLVLLLDNVSVGIPVVVYGSEDDKYQVKGMALIMNKNLNIQEDSSMPQKWLHYGLTKI